MSNSFIVKIKQIEYLEENAHLLKKLYLPVFDTFKELKKETDGCLALLKALHDLTEGKEVIAENLGPVITLLKQLQSELNSLMPQLAATQELYKILYNISFGAKNLMKEVKYLADVDVGWFGSSDTIREGQFSYDVFYYFHEAYYDRMMEAVEKLVMKFEQEGITNPDKNNKYFTTIMSYVSDLVEIILFMTKRYAPNAIYHNTPDIFVSCETLGTKIASLLFIFKFANSLLELYDEIDGAIEGLETLKDKYKGKSKKKISLISVFFSKEGTEELYDILEATEDYLQ